MPHYGYVVDVDSALIYTLYYAAGDAVARCAAR